MLLPTVKVRFNNGLVTGTEMENLMSWRQESNVLEREQSNAGNWTQEMGLNPTVLKVMFKTTHSSLSN